VSTCRSCGAAIVWAQTAVGKRMPVDAEPVDGGNLVLVYPSPGATPLALHTPPEQQLFDDPPRYVSHFSTCPHADQHRKDTT
jgi:hypothetical protein